MKANTNTKARNATKVQKSAKTETSTTERGTMKPDKSEPDKSEPDKSEPDKSDAHQSEARLRMYFMPTAIRYDDLPSEIRAALLEIVLPCYQELVICASGALERSAGVSLTYLLTLEVLEQFELARGMELHLRQARPDPAERTKQIAQHLRLVGHKQRVASFLLRLKTTRHRIDPLATV